MFKCYICLSIHTYVVYVYICLYVHVISSTYDNNHCCVIIDVQVLLLTDLLILMERNEDKDKYKYHLRCHTLIDAVKEKEEVSVTNVHLLTVLL